MLKQIQKAMIPKIRKVESVRDFAYEVLSGKNVEPENVFVIYGPTPDRMLIRLLRLGLSVYRPVPNGDLYLVSVQSIEGLTLHTPIDQPDETEEEIPSRGKPYPSKKRNPRYEDDADDEL